MENENFASAEKVEKTTEETPKMFSQDEVNDIVGKARATERKKAARESERRFGPLMETLSAGTGKTNVEEIEADLRQFFASQGVEEKAPSYSEKDLSYLADRDANEIIQDGLEEVDEEITRLSAKERNPREEAVLNRLNAHKSEAQWVNGFVEAGADPDLVKSQEFQDYAKQFRDDVPKEKILAHYQKENKHHTMGSIRNTNGGDNGVKDFYSYEEASKFTRQELDNNPALMKAIESSMTRWRRS